MDNKEKLELARDWYNEQSTTKKEKVLLEKLFPEIIESEDERIRKELIKLMVQMSNTIVENYTTIEISTFVAWLEKQGEKQDYNPYKATIESIAAMVEKYTNGDLRDFYDNVKVKCKDAVEYNKTWIEKQGEQKHVDKIEPKFKVGDWIVSPGGCYLHILDIEEDGYLCEDILGEETKVLCEHPNCGFKLWTIEDARNGDVLANNAGAIFINADIGSDKGRVTLDCYCYLSVQNEFCIERAKTGSWFYKNEIKPANKEQRDILFQKMKEAGYEWDENEKVLVMIGIDNDEEDKQYEELMEDTETYLNPAWSEDDERYCRYIIDFYLQKSYGATAMAIEWLENLKNRVQPQQKQEWSEEDEEMLKSIIATCELAEQDRDSSPARHLLEMQTNWLKSLKPQSHWKPTNQQMNALKQTSENDYVKYNTILKTLYKDLKKL